MISKKALRAFRSRKMQSYRWMKKISREDLEAEIRPLRLMSRFSFKTKPYLHQLVCFYIGICVDRFMFQLDMGLGKTKIVLDVLWYKKRVDDLRKVLVLVPETLNIEGWEEQILEHSRFAVVPMYGTTKDRWNLVNENEHGVFVLTYAAAMHMVCKLTKIKGKKQQQRKPNTALIGRLAKGMDAIVLDESHAAKNSKSVTYKICNALSNFIPICYELTGTPFGRDPVDFWAQFHIIDKGETLGSSLGLMRESYFKKEMGYFGGKWVFDLKNERAFHKRIQNRSIRYNDRECGDLPEKIDIKTRYSLPPVNREFYVSAIDGIIKAKGDYRELENSFVKLRQICSGFIQYRSRSGKNEIIIFEENPKLEATREFLRSLPIDSNAVIFYEFKPSGDALEAMVKAEGLSYSVARGGMKDKIVKEIKRFKAGKSRVLIANWKSAAEGGNFQKASNYVVFYESPVSPIKRRQCVKRVWRSGQERRCYIYDLVMAGKSSIEQRILEFLEEGESLFQAIVEGKVGLKELLDEKS